MRTIINNPTFADVVFLEVHEDLLAARLEARREDFVVVHRVGLRGGNLSTSMRSFSGQRAWRCGTARRRGAAVLSLSFAGGLTATSALALARNGSSVPKPIRASTGHRMPPCFDSTRVARGSQGTGAREAESPAGFYRNQLAVCAPRSPWTDNPGISG